MSAKNHSNTCRNRERERGRERERERGRGANKKVDWKCQKYRAKAKIECHTWD